MTLDLSRLNDEQRAAVTHGTGALLVISAAGSGKTTTLTYRAAHLIERGVDPSSILLGTFTKKAAGEMAERVERLVGEPLTHVGTLHSLFLRVLRAEEYPWPDFDVLGEYEQKRIIRDLLGKTTQADLAGVIGQISLWKNDLVTAQAAAEEDAYIASVWRDYEAEKRERRALDFDDMLTCAVELLADRGDLLNFYRARTPWLLIDEGQDTSTAQWRLLELLGRTQNLTVVADWRQAIYSWRGARPEAILDFQSRFPLATVVGLPKNYRSTPEIVGAANLLIRHCGRELDDMVPTRVAGAAPQVTIAEDAAIEASEVVWRIREGLELGAKPSDFACLYRVNAYSLHLEEALAAARIPYTVIGSPGFFGRSEIRDVVSYLTFLRDPDDEEALRRIVNRPTRYLGKAYCDAVVRCRAESTGDALDDCLVPPGLNARQRENARAFQLDMQELGIVLRKEGLLAAIAYLRGPMGYDRWLLREEGSGTTDENRLENLAELENVSSRFGDLGEFLDHVAMQVARSKSDDKSDRVQLMTIHRSKGLEWPTVFVAGFAEEVIPHKRSTSPAELEEERRLAYVALTRAKDDLFVSSPKEWQGRALVPSRFTYEACLIDNATAIEAMA